MPSGPRLGYEVRVDPRAEMFRNRLRKNVARLGPWAKQRGLDALRLYDRDIPEVQLVVESFRVAPPPGPQTGRPGRAEDRGSLEQEHLVVWEYARRADRAAQAGLASDDRAAGADEDDEGHDADEDSDASDEHEGLAAAEGGAAARSTFVLDVLSVLGELRAVPQERIHLKRRERQRGAAQYQRIQHSDSELVVREGGHRFLLNLYDFLDTGLFLDHRETRALVQRAAAGRRVLNLFAYTGSFSVYAAAGGALRTVTMDLSSTYLDWAGRNFALNRLDAQRHQRVRADVLAYLADPSSVPQARGPFDLIVLDPPTFSNSKRMRGTLDVLRDHPWLLERALALLAPGGALLFSTSHRGFKLRSDEIRGARFRDLSTATLSRDFRDEQARRCYWVTRTTDAEAALAPPLR
ncbi:MAG: class I SAM-dependent methyltransferase [Polyangia bacterium]